MALKGRNGPIFEHFLNFAAEGGGDQKIFFLICQFYAREVRKFSKTEALGAQKAPKWQKTAIFTELRYVLSQIYCFYQ